MAAINSTAKQEFKIVLSLNESEVKALDALAGYGTDEFLTVFYRQMGRAYLEPHEKGLRDLFEVIKTELPGHISRINEAKKVFNGDR